VGRKREGAMSVTIRRGESKGRPRPSRQKPRAKTGGGGLKNALRMQMTPQKALVALILFLLLGIGAAVMGRSVAKESRQRSVVERYDERVRELEAQGLDPRRVLDED